MPEVTNRTRADWAANALDTFTDDVFYGNHDVEPLDVRAKDLVTNLLHLVRLDAGLEGFDPEAFVMSAVRMHEMEAEEDDDEDDRDGA